MKILKNILLLVTSIFLSYVASTALGDLVNKITGYSGTFLDLRSVVGLPLAYIFFVSLFFSLFGDKKKYYWLGILLIPAAIIELYFDTEIIYIPIVLGILGWLLGLGILKLKQSLRKDSIPS